MEVSMQNSICTAIKIKRRITFKYGKDIEDIIFDPHVLYEQSGTTFLEGNHHGSTQSPSASFDWQKFDISEIIGIKFTQTKFTPDPWFESERGKFAGKIICEID